MKRFKPSIGKWKLWKLKKNIKKKLIEETLKVYQNEIFYQDLDKFLSKENIFEDLINRYYKISKDDYRSDSKVLEEIVSEFIKNSNIPIFSQSEVKTFFKKIIFFIDNELNCSSNNEIRSIINEIRSERNLLIENLHNIHDDISNIDKKMDLVLQEKLINTQNVKLLNKLILEYLEQSIKMIIDGNNVEAEKIINTIFIYGLNGIEKSTIEKIYYIKYALAFLGYKKEEKEASFENIETESFLNNIKNLKKIEANPNSANLNFYFESQNSLLTFLVLHTLFINQEFNRIITELKPKKENNSDVELYYYALSCLNVGSFENAEALECAINIKEKEKYYFFYLISKLNLLMQGQIYSDFNKKEQLEEEYKKLKEFERKNPQIITENQLAYSYIALNVSLINNKDNFFEEYECLDDEIKNNYITRILLSKFYLLDMKYEEALNIYKELSLDFKNEEVYFGILHCFIMLKQYNEIVQYFPNIELEFISPSIIGVYLSALNYNNCQQYDASLKSIF